MNTRRSLTLWLAALLVTALLGMCCATAFAAEPLIVGDLDRNGRIDSRDVRVMLMYIVGNHSLDAIGVKQADLNGDGKVNTIDANMLFRWIAEETTDTAPTVTITTAATTVPTTTTTRPSVDDDGYYNDIVKP